MKQIIRCQLLRIVCGTLAVFAITSTAGADHCFLCRKAAVDMPVSLAVGTIRTSEFLVQHERYLISIQVERRLPFGQMQCMMGIQLRRKPDHCEMFNFDTVLEADWTVWDGDHVVSQGSVRDKDSNFDVSDDTLSRHLGTFVGEKNMKYVLEVKFIKDGTPLNVTNPHLIVMMTKPTDI
jgi:hypothetical protein